MENTLDNKESSELIENIEIVSGEKTTEAPVQSEQNNN